MHAGKRVNNQIYFEIRFIVLLYSFIQKMITRTGALFLISGEVFRLPKGASVPVTLKVLDFELFHFCPIKVTFIGSPPPSPPFFLYLVAPLIYSNSLIT